MLIRDSKESRHISGSFDYDSLNAYLLLILGLDKGDEKHTPEIADIIDRARAGKPVLLSEISEIGMTERTHRMYATESLASAVTIFASGIKRIILISPNREVHGVLSQLRTVRFFWEYGRGLENIMALFTNPLVDLGIRPKTVKSIK